MEKSEEKIKNIVVDTNVVFSSLIKREGRTRAILSFLLSSNLLNFYSPKLMMDELKLHLPELIRKGRFRSREGIYRVIEEML